MSSFLDQLLAQRPSQAQSATLKPVAQPTLNMPQAISSGGLTIDKPTPVVKTTPINMNLPLAGGGQPNPSATLTPSTSTAPGLVNKAVGAVVSKVAPIVTSVAKTIGEQNAPIPFVPSNLQPKINKVLPVVGDVAKNMIQAPFRDIKSVELSLTGKKQFNPVETAIDPTTGKPFVAKDQSLLFGDQPIKDVGGRIADTSKTGQSVGIPKGIADIGAIPLTALATAMDFLPLGGDKKVAEEGLNLVAKSNTVEDFIKAASPELKTFIDNLIQDKNVPINSIEDFFNQVKKSGVVNDLVTSINAAKPVRSAQEALYTQTRSERFAQMEQALQQGGGKAGFEAAVAKTGGEMGKVQFTPLQVTPETENMIFDILAKSDLPTPNKLSAYGGLKAMFAGTSPTKSQSTELLKVYGPDVIKALGNKVGWGEKLVNNAIDIANLPRTLMSTLDVSAPGRQGIFIAPSHPKDFLRSVKNMFGYLTSETKFQDFFTALEKRPTYQLMTDHGVSFTQASSDVTKNEEYFMSNLAEKIPIYGKFVRASDRAYTGFLNNLRADVWDTLYKGLNDAQKGDPKVLNDVSSFVNAATGRGDFKDALALPGALNVASQRAGGVLNQGAPLLNALFFAPRLIASRVALMNPFYYAKLSPPVRKEAMKSAVAFVGSGMAILGLAKLAGADVATDPTNSDFGKIKVGNTRFDIWGGFQQYATYISRMILNQTTSTSGKTTEFGTGYKPETRGDITQRFIRGKLGPDVSYPVDLAYGADLGGNPVTPVSGALSRISPFMLQDMKTAVDEYGLGAGMLIAMPTLWGTGVQTYTPAVSKRPTTKSSTSKKSSGSIGTKIYH